MKRQKPIVCTVFSHECSFVNMQGYRENLIRQRDDLDAKIADLTQGIDRLRYQLSRASAEGVDAFASETYGRKPHWRKKKP